MTANSHSKARGFGPGQLSVGFRESRRTRRIRLGAFSQKILPRLHVSSAPQKASPKGPASGLRMLSYFINRAGRASVAPERLNSECAKRLMLRRSRRTPPAKSRKKMKAR